jgi:hypothetical protein
MPSVRGIVGGWMQGGGLWYSRWFLGTDIPLANCIGAYQAIGAPSLQASYRNLAKPGTYNLTLVTAAPTFDHSTGWTFPTGVGQALNTGITPAANWSLIIRFSGCNDLSANAVCGEYTDTAAMVIAPNRVTIGSRLYNGGSLDHSPGAASGVWTVAGNRAYKDGAQLAGTIPAWTGTALYTIYLGANNAAVASGRPCIIQAAAIYNIVLTPAQVAVVTARMAVLPF